MPGKVLKPSNLNTLIVDPNSDRRAGLKTLLRNSGFNFVMEISKAEYMKQAFGGKQIDLIFFDDDGDYEPFPIAKELRANPDTEQVKMILTTRPEWITIKSSKLRKAASTPSWNVP